MILKSMPTAIFGNMGEGRILVHKYAFYCIELPLMANSCQRNVQGEFYDMASHGPNEASAIHAGRTPAGGSGATALSSVRVFKNVPVFVGLSQEGGGQPGYVRDRENAAKQDEQERKR